MEAESIFPVFGELHADDSPAVVGPCAKAPRKVFTNDAGLFLVGANTDSDDADQTETEAFELSGDNKRDTAHALVALAFLIDFLSATGTNELRKCAEAFLEARP